jgi:hypothetical protein
VRLPASDAAAGTSDSGGASSCFFQYGSTDNPDQITVCVERSREMPASATLLGAAVVVSEGSLGECCHQRTLPTRTASSLCLASLPLQSSPLQSQSLSLHHNHSHKHQPPPPPPPPSAAFAIAVTLTV